MRQRQKRRQDPDNVIKQRRFEPGDLVYEVGRRNGWPIAARNIMLEGTLDVAYYELADSLYRREHGRALLDGELSLFAVGEREHGGTLNIRDKFVTLRDVLSKDPVDRSGKKILAICSFIMKSASSLLVVIGFSIDCDWAFCGLFFG